MSKADFARRLPVLLRADPSRVVVRPYLPTAGPREASEADRPRAQRIVDRVLSLSPSALACELQRVLQSFSDRHHDISHVFLKRFHEVNGGAFGECPADHKQALLIGAYFCQEYSFEAAALFNPSIVAHPDQSGTPSGSVRFILSLRAVGEGHISSVTFRTGEFRPDGTITIDPAKRHTMVPRVEPPRAGVPIEAGVRIIRDDGHDLSECVIFPITADQRHGIEDVRLVRFIDDDGSVHYHGTFSAYSGQAVASQLLSTTDFRTFDLRPLGGTSARSKGMALFPRRIDGRYAMLCRHDNENIWFAESDELLRWDGSVSVVEPRYPWEFVQIGNCGAPIEIDEGWLVITHGVGAVRNYTIGACLLDRNDPTKLLARLTRPLLRAGADEREGYVPNVTYSCGGMVHDRTLVLPYAIADSYTTFATVGLAELLGAME